MGKGEHLIEQIPTTHMKIRYTFANGQLGRQTANKNRNNRAAGQYANKKQTERGSGEKLLNISETQNAIRMNTWKRPRLAKQENRRLKKATTRNAQTNWGGCSEKRQSPVPV